MPETWLFVLARDPAVAKTRLSGSLSPPARADLAAAMLMDVLAAALSAPFARRVVVTESVAVREFARSAGVESLDVPASGTNDAATAAARAAVEGGAARTLLLVSDLPLITAADLELLLSADGAVAIAPDRHRRGTNALLLAPPSAIAPAFGEHSFHAHRERARLARRDTRIVETPGLGTDVDDDEDLRVVLHEAGLGRHTREALGSLRPPQPLPGGTGVQPRDARTAGRP